MYPRRRLIALGVATFLVSLLVLAPARLLVAALPKAATARVEGVSGSLWHGEAQVLNARGPLAVRWDVRGGALLTLGLAVDWDVFGPGLSLTGGFVLRPWGRSLRIERGEVDGERLAGWLARPGTRVDQPLVMRGIEVIRGPGGAVRSARGSLAWGPGQVQVAGRPETLSVPALRGSLAGVDGVLRVVVDGEPQPGQTLATADLDFRSRELHVTVLQRAADIVGLAEKGRRPADTTLVEMRQRLP